jgi:hypothetical protein
MATRKVIVQGTTIVDLTDATATADKILSGYTAYGADGSKLTGTASGGGGTGGVTQDANGFLVLDDQGGGGGGGLEYEEGTWTPSEDIDNYVISFANTHTEAPLLYTVYDATGTAMSTYPTNLAVTYFDCYILTQTGIPYNGVVNGYSIVSYRTRNSSATGNNSSSTVATVNSSDSSSSDTSKARYWATETGIRAYCASSDRLWRAGRTYKWIAVWKPST